MPSGPAWTTISSPRSNRTSEWFFASYFAGAFGSIGRLGQDGLWIRGIAESSGACEDIGEGVTRDVDLDAAQLVRRYGDVDDSSGSAATPSTGPRFPQKSPTMMRAFVPSSSVTSGIGRGRYVLIARVASSLKKQAGWPTTESRACGRAASPFGISWCRMPLPAVIHWTSPAVMLPLLPRLSPCATSPAST